MEASAINVLSFGLGRTRAHANDNSIIKKNRTLDTLPGGEFSVHAHHYCKLEYIISSERFTTRINDCKIEYEPGCIYFLPAYTLHTPTNHYEGEVSQITMAFFIERAEFKKEMGDIPFCLPCGEETKALLFEMLEEKKKSPKNFEILGVKAEKLLRMLAVSPLRRNIESTAKDEEENAEFVRLIKYICEHYSEDLTLSDLAGLVHNEKTYFAKKFKSIYKITPVNYLYAVRLSRSLDELTFSDASIEQIALKVGFKRSSAYSAAFRRAYDISPLEYRKHAKRMYSSQKEYTGLRK